MYHIKQEAPEGWEKAFVVYFGEKRITHCGYMDTAQDTIKKLIGTY